MDHSSNNILVNVSGTTSITTALPVGNEEEHGDTAEEIQRQEEQMASTPVKQGTFFLPENILSVLVGLIEKFDLTRDQFLGIYEEYERIKYLKSGEVKTPTIHQQLQIVQEATTLTPNSNTVVDGDSGEMMDTGEQDLHGILYMYMYM